MDIDKLSEVLADRLNAMLRKQAHDQIASKEFPTSKIKEVFLHAISATDREAAIVIFALVEDITTQFLKEKLTGKVASVWRILGVASNKLDLLAALEWIGIKTYK